MSKERVTINACANAAGSIKLPLQIIGKASRPRCFRNLRMDLLPVKYCGQKNAWMSSELFHSWFHESFVPIVREKLLSLGLPQEAVLVLDNCPAHPNAEELVSNDGKITAVYLPPNVTSLIQPMDQGVLVTLKRLYKKKVLRRLLIEEENGASVVDFLKSVDMKVVVDLAAESWDEIEACTLAKSWRKILPDLHHAPHEEPEDRYADTEEIMHDFRELGYILYG